jgi:alpha-1,3-mannosyltransferase
METREKIQQVRGKIVAVIDMKILHITPGFYPTVGGIQKYIEDLCIGLNKLGHQSDVITFDRHTVTGEKYERHELYRGINIYRLPFINLKYYHIITNIPRILSIARQYDIIHIYGIGPFTDLFYLTRKIHRKPVVLSTVGGPFHTKNLSLIKNTYFDTWNRMSLKKISKIVAISDHDKRLFSRISKNIELIPVPVELDKFKFHERKKSNFAMICIGRISKNKRIDRLIDVVKILASDEPHTKLYVIGRGPKSLWDSLKAYAISSGVEKNVEFVGEASDEKMLECMNKSTFFMSASEYESFGISAVEAMAAGLIAVLNGIDSFKYFVKNGENGFIVDFSKPAEVASLITKLNKTDISSISIKAHERVGEFEPENIVSSMEKLYKKIATQRA